MQFRPKISFEQYLAACQAIAVAKNQQGTKSSRRIYLFLLPCCLIVGLAPQVNFLRGPALLCGGVIILALIERLLAKKSQIKCFKRVYDEEQSFLNDQSISINEFGITCNRGNGDVVMDYRWTAFIKRIETEKEYLFLPSPNSFVRVSKETFTSAEVDQIASWSADIPNA